MRNKCLLALILTCFIADFSFAKDEFGGFQQFVDRGSFKPFTRDLGSLLGAATFHNGRSLGFSGFDIGTRGGIQLHPSAGDNILRKNGIEACGLPWVQAEIGLPFQLDGFIRGISFQGLTIAGGGVRYGITKANDTPWAPHFLVSASAHSVTHRDFSASHFGANLVASAGIPVVSPYVGIGFDRTRVVVRASALDPTLVNDSVATLETRFTAGISVKPLPFVYLLGAYTMTHGQSGFDAGLGIRF